MLFKQAMEAHHWCLKDTAITGGIGGKMTVVQHIQPLKFSLSHSLGKI